MRVLAAAVIGFSLLCSVSALAMNDLNSQDRIGVRPLNIVDLVVENLSTSIALTQQAVSAFVPTPTVGPTDTASFTATPLPSDTATVFSSPTPRQSTPTRRPRAGAAIAFPTHTPDRHPTATKTSVPNTNTPLPPPPPTNTDPPPPPPTNTDPPPPPPTDEPTPKPADTEVVPTNPPVIQDPDATQNVSPYDSPVIQDSDATPTVSP
ncbi:MAG TPA: hypothetical protein VFQ13_03085 [Anaerolineales bacterium]|nr:hypothetical protein [Anaerolineales bacterium]